jgi:hypothetical protein
MLRYKQPGYAGHRYYVESHPSPMSDGLIAGFPSEQRRPLEVLDERSGLKHDKRNERTIEHASQPV